MDKYNKLANIKAVIPNTLMETLDMDFIEVGDDYIVASMPVNSRVHQPAGLLHGGATAALAETVGSTASHMFVDNSKYEVRGIEITANHVRSVKEGMVYAKATIIHKGRTTHLWEIRITDDKERLVSICKLTNIVLPKN